MVQLVKRQPRRPNDQNFRKNDVERLIRCAKNSGIEKFRIAIVRDQGRPTLSLVVGDQVKAGDEPESQDTKTNPWDEILSAANEKRSA